MIPPPPHTALAWRPLGAPGPGDAWNGPEGPDALACFERLRPGGHGWLLDSALRDAGDVARGRASFSFLGAAPYAVARVRGRRLVLDVLRAADPRFPVGRQCFEGDPLELLRRILPAAPRDPAPHFPFCGGAVGYLGYELAEQIDVHALHGRDDLGLPDALLLLVDRVLAVDAASGRRFASALGLAESAARAEVRARAALRALESELRDGAPPAAPTPAPATPAIRPTREPAEQPIDATAYAKAVDEVKQQIAAGNVYQACLTARASRPFHGEAWQLYRRLRRLDPAPFACFLELPLAGLAVVGSSPERFLRVDRTGAVESRPIKGTARRGRDPLEDAAQRDALLRSQKDRAENLMIVDLVRNDLGRVCRVGSVHVPQLMAVESYADVFQLVSTVRGTLEPGRDVFDALRASFPPGSMTGAPKIAAMALLDRLEPVRRGVYSGAIGYFDAYGGADLSVVIRTALLKDGRAWLHAGGGIVADSEPAAEYREALDKLRPLYRALEASEGDRRAAAICSPPDASDEQ
jgi:para-aminobenzoate synthetase component 1